MPYAVTLRRRDDRQAPAGLNRTRDRARPRRASSMPIHPPRELPAMCTVGRPSRSSSSSMPSTKPEPTAQPAIQWRSAGVPVQGRHDDFVVWLQIRQDRDHARQIAPTPCSSSRGVPVPARWLGVSSSTDAAAPGCRVLRRASVAAAATAPPATSAAATIATVWRGLFDMSSGSGQGVSTTLRTSPRSWAATASLICARAWW